MSITCYYLCVHYFTNNDICLSVIYSLNLQKYTLTLYTLIYVNKHLPTHIYINIINTLKKSEGIKL
jgi:hypothetical protein